MFEYEKFGRYTAIVHEAMEKECEAELVSLGAGSTQPLYRAVHFKADRSTLYRINYCSRLSTRILAPLLTFDCHSSKYLLRTASSLEWDRLMSLDTTFAITATVADSKATHSLFAAQVLKDGICDWFRARCDARPSVDTTAPDIRLNLRIQNNRATISLDVSGESLHKRGYRKSTVLAPMQESLAAALVYKSGWDGEQRFWDPMCGSGTILCEALMKYCRIPAQYLREKFGFERMPNFDKEAWQQIRQIADSAIRPLPPGLIRGSDRSARTLGAAQTNLSLLPGGEQVELVAQPFQDAPVFENGIIVTNPPYGVRMGTDDEVAELYRQLGNTLKKKCTGSSAFIYIGNPELRTKIGLKPSLRFPLKNGPIEGELVRIDSFKVHFHDGTRVPGAREAVKTVQIADTIPIEKPHPFSAFVKSKEKKRLPDASSVRIPKPAPPPEPAAQVPQEKARVAPRPQRAHPPVGARVHTAQNAATRAPQRVQPPSTIASAGIAHLDKDLPRTIRHTEAIDQSPKSVPHKTHSPASKPDIPVRPAAAIPALAPTKPAPAIASSAPTPSIKSPVAADTPPRARQEQPEPVEYYTGRRRAESEQEPPRPLRKRKRSPLRGN